MGSVFSWVGVTWGNDSNSLKRGALLFDRLAVISLTLRSQIARSIPGQVPSPDELEWLQGQGIIFNHSPKESELVKLSRETAELGRLLNKVWSSRKKSDWDDAMKVDKYMREWTLRFASLALTNERTKAMPFLDGQKQFDSTFPEGNEPVLHVVLNAVPQPSDTTSWQQIVEFREDRDGTDRLRGLRVWMTDLARSKHTALEAGQKLEWLLEEYQRHMTLHKMKYQVGRIEAVLTVGAEMLESLVKLKLSKFAKMMFELKRRKLNLMEAEMKAPGKELAYIVAAQERFK